MRDELYHYGTKGQKWGKRRYQYDDGTWTEEGKKRRRVGGRRRRVGSNDDDDNQMTFMPMDDDYTREDAIDDIAKYGRFTGNEIMSTYNLLNRKTEKGAHIDYGKYKERLDKISDDDLRKITTRMNLENQYVKLNSERNRSKGKTTALNILRGTGATILTASALTGVIINGMNIYSKIRKLRGR